MTEVWEFLNSQNSQEICITVHNKNQKEDIQKSLSGVLKIILKVYDSYSQSHPASIFPTVLEVTAGQWLVY